MILIRWDTGDRIRIGVSACLLGERVRYDGLEKLDRVVRDSLGTLYQLVPVCPEFELGLGVPREPIGLFGDPARPRLIGLNSGADLTAKMEAWCAARVEQLAAEGIHGFVLKARSPSCGVRGVMVVAEDGAEVPGSGLFAMALSALLPELPIEEDEVLHDPELREGFVQRVRIYGGRRI